MHVSTYIYTKRKEGETYKFYFIHDWGRVGPVGVGISKRGRKRRKRKSKRRRKRRRRRRRRKRSCPTTRMKRALTLPRPAPEHAWLRFPNGTRPRATLNLE